MDEKEAYSEYVVARDKTWAMYDRLFLAHQVFTFEDLDANEEYQATAKRETAAWARFLRIRDANAKT